MVGAYLTTAIAAGNPILALPCFGTVALGVGDVLFGKDPSQLS